jgi:hypothetical protein
MKSSGFGKIGKGSLLFFSDELQCFVMLNILFPVPWLRHVTTKETNLESRRASGKGAVAVEIGLGVERKARFPKSDTDDTARL